jgi:NAD(P)-dependent dehydrogenase (short-subunit alcohol dehydrogenase family)
MTAAIAGATVVTGGSSGIGAAICRHLLERGGAVISLDTRPPSLADPLLHYREVDLTNAEATVAAARAVAAEHRVLRLVNNAGATRPGLIEEATLADLAYVVALHLQASLLLVQAFLPAMKEARHGRIVSIGLRAALGKRRRSVYAATKAGLVGFTRTWALELGPFGITVNLVAPGPIETELFKASNPADSPETATIMQSIAVGRFGTPDDVARAVLFFLEPENGFVTGQTLAVCGGASVGAAPL